MVKCIIQKVERSKLLSVVHEWTERCFYPSSSDRDKKKIKIDGLTRRYLEVVILSLFFSAFVLNIPQSGRLVNFMAIECSSIASMLRFYFILSMPLYQCLNASMLDARTFPEICTFGEAESEIWRVFFLLACHADVFHSTDEILYAVRNAMQCFCSLTAFNISALYFPYSHSHSHSHSYSHVKHERVNLILSSGCFFKHFKSFDDMKFGLCFCFKPYHVSKRHRSTQNESYSICLN